MTTRHKLATLAFVLTWTAHAFTQSASIAGRVTDAATGLPLSSATAPNAFSVRLLNASGTLVAVANTDSAGNYSFSAVAPGSYTLHTTNTGGYANRSSDGVSCTVCEPTRPLIVGAGSSLVVDFALDRSAVIAGRLADRATRVPLAAVVTLYDARWRNISATTSDDAGRYQFASGIAAGPYYVLVLMLPPRVSQAFSDVPCLHTCRLADATPIRVAAAQTLDGIDLLLDRSTGTISGRVIDASGASVAGAVVSAIFQASPFGSPNATTTTNATGDYTLSSLADGGYGVWVRPASGQTILGQIYDGIPTAFCAFDSCSNDARDAAPVVVSGGTAVSGINFTLTVPGTFSGRVTRAGVATAGTVSIFHSSGRFIGTTFADSTGTYTTMSLPAGTYFASAFANVSRSVLYRSLTCGRLVCPVTTGTPIAVTAGAVTTGIDFDVSPSDQGATLRGVVRSSTGAAFSFPFPVVRVYDGDDSFVSSVSAAGDGTYTITNLLPGRYRVQAGAVGFLDTWYGNVCAACGSGRGTAVTIPTDATVDGIDITLEPEGVITGGGVSLGVGISVDAVRADGTVAATGFPGSDQYAIRGLPTGTYYVRGRSSIQFTGRGAFPFGGTLAPALYNGKACDTPDCPVNGGTPVSVTSGSTTTGIDLGMRTGAVIAGSATPEGRIVGPDVSGVVTTHVQVQAYTQDGRAAGNSLSLGDRYTISGLSPGTYYLKATGFGLADQLYKDLTCSGCAPERGTPVTVGDGERRGNIDFVMQPGGSIRGIVRDAAGAPLLNVTVSVYTENGIHVTSTTTTIVGVYTVRSLAAGRYFVATSNDQGYVDEVFDDVGCGTCDPRRGRAVEVTGGATTSGIDFSLARGAIVAGTVRDDALVPAGAATVRFVDAAGQAVARVRANFGSAYIASVPAGTSYAMVEARSGFAARLYTNTPCPGGTCDPTTGTPIVTTVGQVLTGIDFVTPVCAPMSINPAALPVGATGTGYSTVVTAAGASGPFTYAIQDGRLPDGLSLNASTGAIGGTPVAAGRHAFSLGAADGSGCGVSRAYTIDVTSCTPALGGSRTFDVAGALATVQLSLDGSCPAPIAFNVPWLSRGRDLGPGLLEAIVAQNPGGRRTGTITIGNRTLTINQGPVVTASPFGSFDTPADGVVAAGSIAITGWVLDDLRVLNVRLFRSAAPNEPPGDVFLGHATLVPGARPDVEHLFPEYPYANRAGWGYLLLTNMLPNQGNGTFAITAIAEDADRHIVSLGTRTIVANNATATQPFGAIDTPQQGETISGASYVNFGWALTPQPKTIPLNGSTIRVFIDGAVVGTVSYNHFRQDIASLFPGLNNTNGAVGFRMIDTTALADGLHTIAWVVTDDSGASEGIGSRYFTVENGSAQFTSGVLTPPRLLAAPASASVRQVFARELEPISIDLSPYEPSSCRAVFSGVERVGAEQRALPVGSTLDRERGVFKWQPGPGFIGTYRLSFDVGQCDGSVKRIDVDVTIARSDRHD